MMMTKISFAVMCVVALFAGKAMAEEDAVPQEESKPVADQTATGEKKGDSFEDILESPKIKELLGQENIDWDAVMKALGEMNFNMGEGLSASGEESQHEHSGLTFDEEEEL